MKEEALKLADELSRYTINDGVDDLNKRTIAMIRRLVEELECYKRLEDASKLSSKPLSQQYREPIAWLIKTDQENGGDVIWPEELNETTQFYKDEGWEYYLVPLYTTPQTKPLNQQTLECPSYLHNFASQTKPLSDEEIMEVYKQVSEPFGEKRLYEIHDFARAIEERHGIK